MIRRSRQESSPSCSGLRLGTGSTSLNGTKWSCSPTKRLACAAGEIAVSVGLTGRRRREGGGQGSQPALPFRLPFRQHDGPEAGAWPCHFWAFRDLLGR